MLSSSPCRRRATVLFVALWSPIALGGGGGFGEIKVKVESGNLKIKGSNKDDGFRIDQVGLAAGQFRVDPDAFTLLNGASGEQTFSGVFGDIVIDLGKGDDAFGINDAALLGRLDVDVG